MLTYFCNFLCPGGFYLILVFISHLVRLRHKFWYPYCLYLQYFFFWVTKGPPFENWKYSIFWATVKNARNEPKFFLGGPRDQFWRYKSQTYRGPNDILWQLLLGLMPAPKGDCLNDKQIICLVHFYKRCVSGFRCDNICSFLFTGQWRPLYLDSIGCSLHLGVVCPAVGLLWTLANDLCSWIVDRPLLGWVILHSCQK